MKKYLLATSLMLTLSACENAQSLTGEKKDSEKKSSADEQADATADKKEEKVKVKDYARDVVNQLKEKKEDKKDGSLEAAFESFSQSGQAGEYFGTCEAMADGIQGSGEPPVVSGPLAGEPVLIESGDELGEDSGAEVICSGAFEEVDGELVATRHCAGTIEGQETVESPVEAHEGSKCLEGEKCLPEGEISEGCSLETADGSIDPRCQGAIQEEAVFIPCAMGSEIMVEGDVTFNDENLTTLLIQIVLAILSQADGNNDGFLDQSELSAGEEFLSQAFSGSDIAPVAVK